MSDGDAAGRCISCGFLAHHGELLRAHEHLEVKPDERQKPEGAYHPSIMLGRAADGYASYLVCFLGKADLFAEVNILIQSHPKKALASSLPQSVNRVLNLDRRCPFYFRYETGLSPKEHLMERRIGALEEDRRAFQRALDNGSSRLTWAALILGSLLALGQIIAALLAMTPDSYGAKGLQHLRSAPKPQIERSE